MGAAVRAAADGAVVSVRPGVYQEAVALDRDVTLVAAKGPGTVRIVSPRRLALRGCRLHDTGAQGVRVEGLAQWANGAVRLLPPEAPESRNDGGAAAGTRLGSGWTDARSPVPPPRGCSPAAIPVFC